MRSTEVILLALLCIQLSHGQSYECVNEKDGELEFCVFQGVRFFKNTTNVAFAFPGASKPVNVAFKDSHMVRIPAKFLDVFGDDLEVLNVENCKLQSVTITRSMHTLHAGNNFIEQVFMDQTNECSSLVKLDLARNRLKSVRNVTNCDKLKVLNLSGNEALWPKNTIDFSVFGNLNLLEELDLSDNGAFYLDNLKKVGLPSLKLLDLSQNDLLPSDLRLDIMKPFVALETLKLNDNNMEQLDYGELPDFKSLKIVHLNGNNFPCRKLKDMLDFLNKQHNIATPLDRHTNCGELELEGMCCKGPLPTRPPPPPRPPTPSPDTTPHSASDSTTTAPSDPKADQNGESDSTWQIVVAVVVIIAIVASGAGYFIYKKRSN